jgi:hypothetical protein
MMRENGNMLTIKQLVQDDRYRVDPYVVADAILRRLVMRDEPWMAVGAQNECSKPVSSPSPSTKQTPGSPSTTDPIQVKPALG